MCALVAEFRKHTQDEELSGECRHCASAVSLALAAPRQQTRWQHGAQWHLFVHIYWHSPWLGKQCCPIWCYKIESWSHEQNASAAVYRATEHTVRALPFTPSTDTVMGGHDARADNSRCLPQSVSLSNVLQISTSSFHLWLLHVCFRKPDHLMYTCVWSVSIQN